MNQNRKFALTSKLSIAIVATGLLPAAIIGGLALRTASQSAEDVGVDYQQVAENVADKIERNLFERYGDVQAFGVNEAVFDRKSWYQVGSESNRIAAVANRYANLYGFYLLSTLVDLDGRVIAVNDKDPSGKAIDTTWAYQKNYKDAGWFQAAVAGHFSKSDTLDGTVTEDVYQDADLKKVYGGDGWALGFTGLVKDNAGKPIGVWHNTATFSLVEDIVADAYEHLKDVGCPGAELTVLDHQGRVILNYDPTANGKVGFMRDTAVLSKLNLASKGSKAAEQLAAGKAGHVRETHYDKNTRQLSGFTTCSGSMGFPSFKWSVLIQVPESQALNVVRSQLAQIGVVLGISVLGLVAVGCWLGRSISRPLMREVSEIREIGEQVGLAAREVSISSQKNAEGASEQAASLEETSASLEEISAMTKRNAESAQGSKSLSQQARDSAALGLESVSEMGRTLTTVKGAVGEMESAVNEMQSSSQEIAKIIKTIDEIAFQTNLLALNAAVEAARAGEAGAGFAVVADEVRSLAQRSAQAAKDTSEKIESAVQRSQLGGTASRKVVASLGDIEVSAKKIQDVFSGIEGQIRSLDSMVGEISAASKEQSTGISEVNMAVSQMDKVTQSNAAAAEENASAAEELNSQVGSLKRIVEELRIMVAGSADSDNASSEAAAPSRPAAEKPAAAAKSTRRTPSAPAVPSAPGFGKAPRSGDIPMPEPSSVTPGTFKDF